MKAVVFLFKVIWWFVKLPFKILKWLWGDTKIHTGFGDIG